MMMESLKLSISVAAPLLVYIGIGLLIRNRKWMSPKAIKEMNQVVFKVFLSIMVFLNIYQSDLKEDFDVNLILYAVAVLFVMVFTAWFVVGRIVKEREIAPVIIQGIYRSNFVLFGLQVTASICGKNQLGMTTVLISIIIPLFNAIAVVLFEIYRNTKVDFTGIIKGIIKNPLIIASIMGIMAVFMNIQLNTLTEDILETISKMATPMSLILLGGMITLEGIRKYWKYTISCAICRLIMVPAIFLSIAVWVGFRGAALVALMVMLGAPTAVSSFPMAAQMGGNEELAGQIVAVTTFFSIITIFMWTYFLSCFELII